MSAAVDLRPVPTEAVELSLGFTPTQEFRLLLACCSTPCDQERSERIRQVLAHAVDWKQFSKLVQHHRVVPQVYGCLARFPSDVPTSALTELRSAYEANARNALRFTRELIRILRRLQDQGIRAMPYKGPALAQSLYGDVTARQFSDLDLLIHADDVTRAKAALAGLGYKPKIQLAPREERAYLDSGYEYSFDSVHGANLLEIQWRILPHFYAVDFDLPRFFGRAREVRLNGYSFPTLCTQDLLPVLCVHAAKHVWGQLSWLCDIAQLAASAGLDWDAVWAQAKQLGVRQIVALNLFLANELLGSPLPCPIHRWMKQNQTTEAIAGEVLRIVADRGHYDTESIPYFRLMLRLRERRQDQARFLQRLLWTPGIGEWSAVLLPPRLSSLYGAVRLWRLARRFVSRPQRDPSPVN